MLAYWPSAFKKLADTKCCSFSLSFKGYFLKAISVVTRIKRVMFLEFIVFFLMLIWTKDSESQKKKLT